MIALWNHDWLAVDHGNGPTAADGDFVLVIARCAPSFIVMMNDAQARGGGGDRVCLLGQPLLQDGAGGSSLECTPPQPDTPARTAATNT